MNPIEIDPRAVAGKIPRLKLGVNEYKAEVDVSDDWRRAAIFWRVVFVISLTNKLQWDHEQDRRDPGIDLTPVVNAVNSINASAELQQAVFERRYSTAPTKPAAP